MTNTFKVGDKFTINAASLAEYPVETRDCTAGKVYELTLVGVGATSATEDTEIPEAVRFTDDVGEAVDLAYDDITLAEGE